MKRIQYDRATRDFSMFLNGRYVGSRATYTQAEQALNALAYETLRRMA
jgi:hypothetical protein